MSENLIRAENLSVGFPIGKGLFNKFVLKAVDNVTVHIEKGSFFRIGRRIRLRQDDTWTGLVESRANHRRIGALF